ncbi:MAG: efflux RND transporter periplasmic adaptor subunit [Prochlorothrix sp.]
MTAPNRSPSDSWPTPPSDPPTPDRPTADLSSTDSPSHQSPTPDFSTPQYATPDRQSRPGAPWLIGGIGVLLLGGGIWAWRLFGAAPEGEPQMPAGIAVTLAPVAEGPVQQSSDYLGTLEALTGVVLQPEVSGRVTQVFVTAGDRVSPGQSIILVSPDRTAAELEAVTATVTAAQAAQNAATAALKAAELRKAELEADLALKAADLQRVEYLVNEGAQSQQALDVARRDRDVAQASLAAAIQDIAAAKAQQSQAAAALSQAQANRTAAAQNLQDRTVTAPIAGLVGNLDIKLGDYVSPDTVITTITENSTLTLEIPVPVEQRDRLRLGLPVEVLSMDGMTVMAKAQIRFISPQTNTDTQTVLVKAQLDNSQDRFQDAQQVETRLIWSEETGLLVPTSAIARLGGQTFVYLAEPASPEATDPAAQSPPGNGAPGQVARLRPVTLGAIQGNDYEVLEGVIAGDTIVATGILNLQDGMPILPQAGDAVPTTDPTPP